MKQLFFTIDIISISNALFLFVMLVKDNVLSFSKLINIQYCSN